MADMTGQVALITGGIRGIGRAISERLAARGVEVAAGYSHGKEAAEKFAAEYPRASVHQGNIGVVEDCERVIQEVLDRHGRLDILVNNAGITLDKTVRKMTPQDCAAPSPPRRPSSRARCSATRAPEAPTG